MLSVPVYNEAGQEVGAESIDEALLGGGVNTRLLKQALVMYQNNRRQGTVAQKSRGEVAGSTRKLYRQKGTGNARMGTIRQPVRRGGGRAFPRKPRDYRNDMPRKMRRLARDQAVLAKIRGSAALIVDGLKFEAPKTKRLHTALRALGAADGCTLATAALDAALYRSGRNIPKVQVTPVAELNAFDVLRRPRLIFTRDAFQSFVQALGSARKPGASA